MGVYIWSNNPRLPAEYQEVEYIQNSGNLYINSGYAPNQDTKAELKFSNWTEIGSYDVFGTDKNFANSGFTLLSTVPCYGNQTITVSKNVADGNLHTITLGKDGYTVDGDLQTTFNTQTFSSLNLYLFALNRNGSAREYAHYRFYYMKIWDNGTLVRDFIPCYRKSDDVIGLYDLVNSQFYTKSGSGTFTKGSNVIYFERELKNAYIGSTPAKRIMMRPNGVEKQVRPSGGGGWQPGANTIAYYPLTTNFNDASGNGYNLTNSGGTITTSDGVACAYFSGSSNVMASASINVTTQDSTFACWMKKMRHTDNERFIHRTNDNIEQAIAGRGVQGQLAFINWQNGWRSNGYNSNTPEGQWIFVVATWGSTGNKVYLNGVEQTLSYFNGNASSTALNVTYATIVLGNNRGGTQPGQCYLSNVIVENKVWTAQEVADYYNQTKGNYGL